jgi:hypoxanthine phosphoribosyltransferase
MHRNLNVALLNSELIHERADIERAIARMAVQIRNDYAGERPVYLTVMHGGMLFASLLALEIGQAIDLEFDYLHATRYRGDTTGGNELHWLRRPEISLKGRRVLLIDDIVDEGHTLAEVRDWCRAQGAADVRIAAMTVKKHDRCVPGLSADYAGLDVPDRYVYGFGMDYHEQGRNLPAVYALKG